MAAGFEVRNHSTVVGDNTPEAMFTIQVLAETSWAVIDLEAATAALTAAYAAAAHELTKRVAAARSELN